MDSKKTLLIIILAFVVLLGGAYVLYTQLGQTLAPDQLAVQQPQQQAEMPEESKPESSEETVPVNTEEPTAGQMVAPDFTVYDAQGNEVHLSDYFGKPIVVNFWASWCGPCQGEMPDFEEKYQALGEDVTFLMINMTDGSRETVESASAFIAEKGYTFPVFYDTQMSAAITYRVYSLPTTFFIDGDGYAIAQAAGAIDAETLQRGIDMIL